MYAAYVRWSCIPFPVCLCLRDERPGESQGLSPKLSESFVNGGGLGLVVVVVSFFQQRRGQKTERVNDGGRGSEEGGAPWVQQDNSPDVGSFTDTGNA